MAAPNPLLPGQALGGGRAFVNAPAAAAQAAAPAVALQNGPPRRNGKTAAHITDEILNMKGQPTYFNKRRACDILGYSRSPKPALATFVGEINSLWTTHANLRTRRARRARALMLDALRTLGFRNPYWTVESARLNLDANCSDGGYRALPTPQSVSVQQGVNDAREYLAVTPAPVAAPEEPHWARVVDMVAWRKFHRFQGFTAAMGTAALIERQFRVVHVPQGPDSLWHALS